MNNGSLGVLSLTNGKSTPIVPGSPGYGAPNLLPPIPAPSGKPVVQGQNITAGGGGQVAAQAAPDPYASYGGKAAYDSLVSGFNTQKSNIYGSSTDAANTAGRGLGSSIQDLIDQLTTGQHTVDNNAVNNELAKAQGLQGILGMVGRGIRSSGVMLAGKNAGDSSAAGALARAYGDIGSREAANVGNQYELGNRNITTQQQGLDLQRASGVRKITEGEANSVDLITSQARDRLASLDAAIAGASLPDRINIENEKNAIRNQVRSVLDPYIDSLGGKVGAVQASSGDARRSQAAELLSKGTDLGAGAFNFTDHVPAQFQGTGPFSSELPLFLQPGKKQTV